MELIKKILIIIGGEGAFLVVIAVGGADCGANEKAWMSAAIIGVLMIILSRLMYCRLNWIQEEREKKSIRNRRYQETQNKMSA